MLNQGIIDVDGTLDTNIDNLPFALARLLFAGQLDLGNLASINALVELLQGGGCSAVGDADDTTDPDEGTDPTDPGRLPVVDVDICAALLVNDVINVDGSVIVDSSELPTTLQGLLDSKVISLGNLADVNALVELLQGGGCLMPDNTDPGGDGNDTGGGDADDSADGDASDSTDGDEPPVVDLEICAVLLGENILDSEGNLAVDLSALPGLLGGLIESGDLTLGDIASIDALIAILTDGGCADLIVGPDPIDNDSTDADATDADASDSTDGEEPPVVDLEICAVLLGENILDSEGNLAVDLSALPGLLGALIESGDLTLGDIASIDALIAILTDGGCADDADATDADATDADATDADATDADATDADATDADATDANATDADATDADATDADATDADATDADATDADATDADATDADGNDGADDQTGTISAVAYECDVVGDINLEYKDSSEPAAGTSGCEPGTATVTFTSVETGEAYVIVAGVSASASRVSMPLLQVAAPDSVTIDGTSSIDLPAGAYTVSLDGSASSIAIEVAEGDTNPSLVVSLLAGSQVDPAPTATPVGVTGLPSIGSGFGASDLVWPIAAAGMVLLMLAGHFVTVRSGKNND